MTEPQCYRGDHLVGERVQDYTSQKYSARNRNESLGSGVGSNKRFLKSSRSVTGTPPRLPRLVVPHAICDQALGKRNLRDANELLFFGKLLDAAGPS
ncbi:hypothetical protein SCP_0302200 [Sparassis crispa]|uniref:Uncharacterized protein n=1 Tax=Sparassis crispa TaxID=139825 RepID=A0A401GEF6_9APHY|nr:hypothetical protein SCP_0302200 [Sparassis crispa]GBE80505.1 hypothetical protein SCP_0302200 [Sparassis crispa]